MDGTFASLAKGVAEDRYVLWLGSGISLGRMDGLKQVIGRVIEFLRTRIEADDPDCRFAKALNAALTLASLSHEERARVDLALPFDAWRDSVAISLRLVSNYARLLDIVVEGEADDYLLWEAVDVRSTFADPAKLPDVEHLCLAILMLEGAASDLISANWDGLIERAMEALAGRPSPLTVCARPDDLREPSPRARLIKIHGCATKAEQDESNYRAFLVARQSQIHGWIAHSQNAALVTRLLDLIATKPTLMLGLSAQDANIQALFADAAARLQWHWPGDRPSYVFSEDELGIDQQGLLQNVYRGDWTPATRRPIVEGSRVQAYAKPLLLALVLHVLCAKVEKLIDTATAHLEAADRLALKRGINALRDMAAASAQPDPLIFINALVDQCGRAMRLIRSGSLERAQGRYQPISIESISGMPGNPDLIASGLKEAAIAVGIIGAGVVQGAWMIKAPASLAPGEGTLQMATSAGNTKVFLAAGAQATLQLWQDGHISESEEPIIIQGHKLVPAMPRSPRGAPGRIGRLGAREVSIAGLLEVCGGFEELFQRFREELAI